VLSIIEIILLFSGNFAYLRSRILAENEILGDSSHSVSTSEAQAGVLVSMGH